MRIQEPESRIQNERQRPVRPPAKCFEDLVVWQKTHQFVLGIYQFTEHFPSKELYGLTSQLRRAAVSIPANIAEGFKKRGKPDKVRFLNIAQGSLEECRYYLILSTDLHYGNGGKLIQQLEEVSKILESYAHAVLDSGS